MMTRKEHDNQDARKEVEWLEDSEVRGSKQACR